MPNIVSNHALDPTIHDAVEQDGIPRDGRYRTEYDDGSQAETIHMLYRDGGMVRSVPIEGWSAEQQALAARDADRTKHEAMNASLRSAAATHKGKQATLLTFPEMRDFLALLMDERGLLDSDGKVK